MKISSFKDIKDVGYELDVSYSTIKLDSGDGESYEVEVKHYLPIDDKGKLVNQVINGALDINTGCFSPLRLNVYFDIAVMEYYCGVNLDGCSIPEAYDILESSGLMSKVLAEIPEEERNFIQSLVDETAQDIARYNNSFAGMVSNVSSEAGQLDTSIQDILEKIKNKEGLEVLSEIKNVVGTD